MFFKAGVASIFYNVFCKILMFDISDLMCLFDRLLYLYLLRQFRVFCDVNSTSYGPYILKDGRGSDRPRIFSGIHRRCHRDKACPPPFSKIFLAATAYGELSQFLFLYIKCDVFQVKPFVAYTTCDLGSWVATQTLWLFDISVSAVWQVSVTHSFFLFLSPPASIFSTPSID